MIQKIGSMLRMPIAPTILYLYTLTSTFCNGAGLVSSGILLTVVELLSAMSPNDQWGSHLTITHYTARQPGVMVWGTISYDSRTLPVVI